MKKAGYKEIFISIAGSTPQVITETIYALAVKKPPVIPDEIFIITTFKGKVMIENALIGKGILKELCQEYNLPPLSIKDSSFIIPFGCSGNALEDIRNEEENEAMGDLITSFVREKTNDPACRLHCSIAGGRKTMSFYLGAAMQLFGRPWDKLYHVLVTPEFESNQEFYYKPKEDVVIRSNGKSLHTKDAQITLAELPFIRLRNKVSLSGRGFRELVREGQKEIDIAMIQPQFKVNLSERTIHIGDNLIEMVPMQLMIYSAYLRQKTDHCKYPARAYCLDCTDCFPSIVDLSTRHALEEMAKDYKKIYGVQPLRTDDLLAKHKDGLDQSTIRQNLSKINRTIKEQLSDETLYPYYIITSVRKYAGSKYGVRVEKGKMRIE